MAPWNIRRRSCQSPGGRAQAAGFATLQIARKGKSPSRNGVQNGRRPVTSESAGSSGKDALQLNVFAHLSNTVVSCKPCKYGVFSLVFPPICSDQSPNRTGLGRSRHDASLASSLGPTCSWKLIQTSVSPQRNLIAPAPGPWVVNKTVKGSTGSPRDRFLALMRAKS